MRDVHLVKFEHVDRSAAIYLRKRTLDGAFPRTDMNDQPVTVNVHFGKKQMVTVISQPSMFRSVTSRRRGIGTFVVPTISEPAG